jgi:hypothetical protein
VGKRISHFFGVMQRDGFNDQDEFKKPSDFWIYVFRKTKTDPSTNSPLIPGR